MTITDLKPSTLDNQFVYYKDVIEQLHGRYTAIFNIIGNINEVERHIDLYNKSAKPCISKYINLHLQLLTLDINDTTLQTILTNNFFGFTRTRLSFGTGTSAMCQIIPHEVDFDNEVSVIKVYEFGKYRAICNRPNMYYVVYGADLTVYIDGKIYTGDSFEFITLPDYEDVYVESTSDFTIKQFNISQLNDGYSTNITVDFDGFDEITFKSYVKLPAKITINNQNEFLQFPTTDGVYKLKYSFKKGDVITVTHIVSDYRDYQFAGIICCARRWQL